MVATATGGADLGVAALPRTLSKQRLGDARRHANYGEVRRGIEIVFPRLIHDAQLIFGTRLFVGQEAIELTGLEIVAACVLQA
jgi:hypothetical protein